MDAEKLILELDDCCTMADMSPIPNTGEPFGADCGLLRDAARRIESDQSTIARLTAEVEALRVDAGRLDWLDRQRGDDVRQVGHDDFELVAHYWSVQGQCADVRSAIDDAIAANPEVAMPSVDQETGSVTGRGS